MGIRQLDGDSLCTSKNNSTSFPTRACLFLSYRRLNRFMTPDMNSLWKNVSHCHKKAVCFAHNRLGTIAPVATSPWAGWCYRPQGPPLSKRIEDGPFPVSFRASLQPSSSLTSLCPVIRACGAFSKFCLTTSTSGICYIVLELIGR